jgi:hypothetical protein
LEVLRQQWYSVVVGEGRCENVVFLWNVQADCVGNGYYSHRGSPRSTRYISNLDDNIPDSIPVPYFFLSRLFSLIIDLQSVTPSGKMLRGNLWYM